jgi:hypothetical protein
VLGIGEINTRGAEVKRASLVRLATAVSWSGHPLVFVSISVGIVVSARLAPRTGLPILAALFFSVIVPTGILLFLGVRSGRWRDADVSVREERRRFYPLAIPLSAMGALALSFMRAPGFVLRGALVTLMLLIMAAVINFRLKLSLHTLFAFYCAVILFRINVFCGVVALVLAALVFWSRLFLSRHSLSENIAGVALGFAGGIVTAWWP